MISRKLLASFILGGSVLVGAAIGVAAPVQNISAKKHPNLAAAQRLVNEAFERISSAERAQEWDMGGHAERAKQLLDEVNIELKRAAEMANEGR